MLRRMGERLEKRLRRIMGQQPEKEGWGKNLRKRTKEEKKGKLERKIEKDSECSYRNIKKRTMNRLRH